MSHGSPASEQHLAPVRAEASQVERARRSCPRKIRIWQVALLTATVGSVAYYLPLLGGLLPDHAHWPGFMLTGDQRMGYFPSFVEGYRRFWHGGLAGIDFFTEDGASLFAFRPNLMPYYPPYLAAYLLVDCSNIRSAMQAYVTIFVAHQFVGLFFTVVFAGRYLRFPPAAAVLAASLYALNWYAASYSGESTFYFQMMLLPMAACTICFLFQSPSRLAFVWASPVFITVLLSSYAPTMVASLGLAIVASMIAILAWREMPVSGLWRRAVRPVASLALVGLVCFPYFYAQLRFKSVMMATADDIDPVAHTLSLSAFDLLNGISQFLDVQRTHFEALLVWGAIPLFLGLVGFDVLVTSRDAVRRSLKTVIGLSALVYVVILLPMLGGSLLPATDIFYYAVPILGKMHIFQRYLIFTSFFFAIAVTGLAVVVVQHASEGIKRTAAYLAILIWIGVGVLFVVRPPAPTTDTRSLLVELFLVAVTGIAIAVTHRTAALLVAAAFCAIVGLNPIYEVSLAENRLQSWQTEPDPLGREMQSIADFFVKNGDGKALSKLVIASPLVETYLDRNLPWLLGTRAKVMNFQGEPPHLSVLADYGAAWGSYGVFDVPWLNKAGVDFVYWNDADLNSLKQLTSVGYTISAVLSLSYGNHVGKLNLSDDARIKADILLDSTSNEPGRWPKPLLADGWQIDGGQATKQAGSVPGRLYLPVSQSPGGTYDVSFDTEPGAKGHIDIVFGSQLVDQIDVEGASRYSKRVRTAFPGNLWLIAAPTFSGSLSHFRVGLAPEAGLEAGEQIQFDNGIIRLSGPGTIRTSFGTDYTKRISLVVDSDHANRLTFLLWPNPYLRPYIDGQLTSWSDNSKRPLSLNLPAGHHSFDLRFKSYSILAFTWLTGIYLFLLIFAIFAETGCLRLIYSIWKRSQGARFWGNHAN